MTDTTSAIQMSKIVETQENPRHRVTRETLLRALEVCESALSAKETIQQSTCFVFDKGKVIAFNEQMCIHGPSGLPEYISGAVRADKLLNALRKLSEEEVLVSVSDGSFLVHGQKKEVGVRMDSTITLPYAQIEEPDRWHELPEDFTEAIQLVSSCCSTEDTTGFEFAWSCIHIHPEWIEACDGFSMLRWKLDTQFWDSAVIKNTAARAINRMGANEFAMTRSWVHFENKRGFRLSVRRYLDKWPSEALTPWLEEKGSVVALPKGLKESCEKAQDFTKDRGDSDLVKVTLTSNQVRIQGEGPLGWYKERAKVDWGGPDLEFYISPKLLGELVEKYPDVMVTGKALKIDGGSYTYCTRLTIPQDKA